MVLVADGLVVTTVLPVVEAGTLADADVDTEETDVTGRDDELVLKVPADVEHPEGSAPVRVDVKVRLVISVKGMAEMVIDSPILNGSTVAGLVKTSE